VRGSRAGNLAPLTGLRACAALLVFAGHLEHLGLTDQQEGELRACKIFTQRTTAVGLFFALSGFVLAYRHGAERGAAAASSFLRGRLKRLLPLYLIAVTAYVPVGIAHHDRPAYLSAQYLGLQAWIPNPHAWFTWHGGAWSVSTEFFFYLCFPLVLPLLRRLRSQLDVVVVWGQVWLTLLVVWVVRIYLQHGSGLDFWVYPFPPVRLLEFLLGALTATLFQQRSARPLPLGAGPLGSALLVILLCTVPGAEYKPLAYPLLFVPCFSLLLYFLASSRGLSARALSSPALQWAGETSYAFYLLAGSGLAVGGWTVDQIGLGPSFLARSLVGVPVALVVGGVVADLATRAVACVLEPGGGEATAAAAQKSAHVGAKQHRIPQRRPDGVEA